MSYGPHLAALCCPSCASLPPFLPSSLPVLPPCLPVFTDLPALPLPLLSPLACLPCPATSPHHLPQPRQTQETSWPNAPEASSTSNSKLRERGGRCMCSYRALCRPGLTTVSQASKARCCWCFVLTHRSAQQSAKPVPVRYAGAAAVCAAAPKAAVTCCCSAASTMASCCSCCSRSLDQHMGSVRLLGAGKMASQ